MINERSNNYTHHFSVRNIDSISLKYHEGNVSYIDNKTDRTNFAVSTAAHWQRKGGGPIQYWACTSTIEREDSTFTGGLIVCVEDRKVWWSFDNMKVKEPSCKNHSLETKKTRILTTPKLRK